VLEAVMPSETIPAAISWPLGALLLLVGLVLLRNFLGSFHRAETPVEPWKPTTAIVTEGPYRFTRNPAYLGMALTYAGIAVLCKALWPFATLIIALIAIDRGVIAREERYLEREFGEEYLGYKRTVRRWI
jgi:protein-S-isoprenylcysteine O-methyltransferase Ste14